MDPRTESNPNPSPKPNPNPKPNLNPEPNPKPNPDPICGFTISHKMKYLPWQVGWYFNYPKPE